MRGAVVRILIWPTISYAGNIDADSLYIIARNLIRAASKDINWVLIVPDSRNAAVDDLDDMPNVQKVKIKLLSPSYRQQEATMDQHLVWKYAQADGDEPVDAVISMSPHRSLNLANAFSQKEARTSRQVIVTWDLLVRDDGAGEFVAGDEELIHAAAGNLASDLIIHESPVARKMTLDVARKYLSMSSVKRIMENSVDVMQGISAERVKTAVETVKKREKFTVYYGGRFSKSKRLDEIAEVVDYFYKFGRDVEFVITTGSLDGTKDRKFREMYPHVDLKIGLSQEEAFNVMASCHASLCFSSHELFGMAFWEQMAAGLGVVMLGRSWNEELVPPGYESLVQTPQQAGARLRMLYEEWQEDPEGWGKQMYESTAATYVRENYDANKNLLHMAELVTGAIDEVQEPAFEAFREGKAKNVVEAVEKALEGVEEISLHDLWKKIRKEADVGRNFIGARMRWGKSNSTLDGLRAARLIGYKDCYLIDESGEKIPGVRKAL